MYSYEIEKYGLEVRTNIMNHPVHVMVKLSRNSVSKYFMFIISHEIECLLVCVLVCRLLWNGLNRFWPAIGCWSVLLNAKLWSNSMVNRFIHLRLPTILRMKTWILTPHTSHITCSALCASGIFVSPSTMPHQNSWHICEPLHIVYLLALCIIYTLAYKITKNSTRFLNSFASCTSNVDRLENKKFFKSCQPIYVRIGTYTVISRNLFICVLHEISLNALISLLVGIPVIEYV